MSSQNLCRKWAGRGWLAGAVAVGLLAPGCAPDYVTGNTSPVNLSIVSVSPSVLASDIRSGSQQAATGAGPLFTCPDFATVTAAVRPKNPLTPSTQSMAVVVTSYSVRYFRTDGRGVEGVDVPYRVTGNLTLQVASGASTGIPIEVVRHQAKNEPPLSAIFQATVLTIMAEVTLYGNTVAGEAVSASGTLQIDFADYGDNLTACAG
jgi:hypothetical protein